MSADTRRVRRSHLSEKERIELLEDDQDDAAKELHALRADVKEEMGWIRRSLLTASITVAVSAIGLALTIVFTVGGAR